MGNRDVPEIELAHEALLLLGSEWRRVGFVEVFDGHCLCVIHGGHVGDGEDCDVTRSGAILIESSSGAKTRQINAMRPRTVDGCQAWMKSESWGKVASRRCVVCRNCRRQLFALPPR